MRVWECRRPRLPYLNKWIDAFDLAMGPDFIVDEVGGDGGSDSVPILVIVGDCCCLSSVDELLIGHDYVLLCFEFSSHIEEVLLGDRLVQGSLHD